MPWPGQKTDWIDFEIEGGPLEYIGFFKNADFVVTNSFHGLVFSVLMEKQFLIFSHSNKNVRIENLVEKLNLKQNLIEYGRIPDEEEILKEIDWECVEKLLEKERAHSTIFIINQFLK
jgi:exopolysaccharide biosynthesis predicted pyruvyltransferase EpsI